MSEEYLRRGRPLCRGEVGLNPNIKGSHLGVLLLAARQHCILRSALLSTSFLLSTPTLASDVQTASDSYALQPGWNLLHFPESALARDALEAEGFELWPLSLRTPDAPRSPIRPSVAQAGVGYWVWSAKTLSLPWDGQTETGLVATSTASRWRFLGVTDATPFEALNLEEAFVWNAHDQNFQSVETEHLLLPGHGYWVRPATGDMALRTEDEALRVQEPEVGGPQSGRLARLMRRSLSPRDVGATASGGLVQLWWKAPTHFDDGARIPPGLALSFRVFRDGEPVTDVHATEHEEAVAARVRPYKYQVSAVVENPEGVGLESIRSQPIHVAILAPGAPPPPGDFETPASLTDGRERAGMPKTALSTQNGKTYAHVAYVTWSAGGKKSNIRYAQSEKAGVAGSFGPARLVSTLAESRRVSFLALAAHAHQVSLAWVEEVNESRGGQSEIYVVQSQDGGRSFGPPQSVRRNTAWKHNPNVGYDRFGRHHLVWGEAHKVYYLKNLEGVPSSVFDVRKREVATEKLQYMAYYAPFENTPCTCKDCWCEESYLLRDPPSQGGQADSGVWQSPPTPSGTVGPGVAFVERIEESDVHEPSLHIDGDTLSIVARQSRMWDNKPVLNPAWVDMVQRPIYSDVVVQRQQPTRLLVGWRSVWKTAFAEGDRDLVPGIGYQHQYLYSGSWHDEPQIKVAQRPLTPGAWGKTHRTVTEWRISTVASGRVATDWQHTPAYPQVYTSSEGVLTAVFEQSALVPSQAAEANALTTFNVASSKDGGLSWSAYDRVGVGQAPQLAISAPGETGILFFAPETSSSPGAIRWVYGQQGQGFGPVVTLSRAPVLSVRRGPRGENIGVAFGAPSLSAHAELFLAAWVRKGAIGRSHDQIVTARAARVSAFSHLDVEVKKEAAPVQSVAMTVRAVNKYFMPVDTGGAVEVSRSATSPARFDGSPNVVSLAEVAPLALRFELQSGVGELILPVVEPQEGLAPGDATVSMRFTNPQHGIDSSALRHVTGKDGGGGRYAEAIGARDRLLRHPPDMEEPAQFYYQVEYLPGVPHDGFEAQDPATEPSERLSAQDAHHLAGFERVWAYTQGITLAQLATSSGSYGPKAIGLARYLCHHAVRKPNGIIMGWPFSWNTKDDDWADARLVTGANAWVIHGLGVFLTSDAYREAPPEDQKMLMACYQNGLDGLQEHRRRLPIDESRMGSLMSAGWTTRGLESVGSPHRLRDENAGLFKDVDLDHRFSYYSVLDAIGYGAFSPTEIRICALGDDCGGQPFHSAAWQVRAVSQEAEWAALKARVPAQNVVTEHSLDVLQVLKHALKHSDSLGPQNPESRRAWTQKLASWRNELRDGVFFLLWDGDGWRDEFIDTLAHLESEKPVVPLTAAQAHRRALRMQAMQSALDGGSLGRVITGGTIHHDAQGVRFEASPHTAIDNCSWLALSVEDDLDGFYAERLGRCLEYTVIQFVKDLSAGDEDCDPTRARCPPRRTYRGTHYFQNAFKDPYIEPSLLQESSYHLEATMGLILGLLKFAQAHPGDPSAAAFLEEAHQLWGGAQSFVDDHGFLYSSQRIQDLSARLESSTALVWFIDVYTYFAENIDPTLTLRTPEPDVPQLVEQLQILWSGVDGTEHGAVRLGAKTTFINGKVRTKGLQSVVKMVDELLRIPAPLAAAAMSSMVAAGHLSSGFTEIDPGLETIFLGGEAPPGEYWEPAGFIVAEDILAQPLRTYVRDESEIRAFVPLYRDAPTVISQDNLAVAFDDDRIYYFQVGRQGIDESPLGDFRVLLPSPGAVWPVYALKSSHGRYDILNAFVQAHPRWKKAQAAVSWLPESVQSVWLSLVEISVRSEFGTIAAQEFGLDAPFADTPFDPSAAAGIARPDIEEIKWHSDAKHGTQFTVEFTPGSGHDFGREFHEAVIECSYNQKNLSSKPYQRDVDIIRREGTPRRFEIGQVVASTKDLEEQTKRFNKIPNWMVSASFFGDGVGFPPRDKDLRCKLWVKQRHGEWSEAADFSLRLWRDWTPVIGDLDGYPYIDVPVGRNMDEGVASVLDAIPSASKIYLNAASIYDCGPTGDEKVTLGIVVVSNSPSSFSGKKNRYMRIHTKSDGKPYFKWDHYYCIGMLTQVEGKGSEDFSIRIPEKQIYIPPKGSEGQAYGDDSDASAAFYSASEFYAYAHEDVSGLDTAVGGIHVLTFGDDGNVHPDGPVHFEVGAYAATPSTWTYRVYNDHADPIELQVEHLSPYLRVEPSQFSLGGTGLTNGDDHTPRWRDVKVSVNQDALVGYPAGLFEDQVSFREAKTGEIWATRFVTVDLVDRLANEATLVEFQGLVGRLDAIWSKVSGNQWAEPIQLGTKTVFINGKARTKLMQAAVKAVDELMTVPAPLAAAAMSSMVAAGHISSGFTEVDPGLETIFLGGDAPSAEYWEPAGFIMAQDILAEPLGTYVRDEMEIRRDVPLYREPPSLVARANPAMNFDDELVYYFLVDRIGIDESPVGGFRFLDPEPDAEWEVYALRADQKRERILDTFVTTHPRWVSAQASSSWMPDPIRGPWLSLVELTVRSEFGRSDAEAFVHGSTGLHTRPESLAADVGQPELLEIGWEHDATRGTQIRIEFIPGNIDDFPKEMEEAVLECSPDEGKLRKQPFETDDGIIRRTGQPIASPYNLDENKKTGDPVKDALLKFINFLPKKRVNVPYFGPNLPFPGPRENETLKCRLWVRGKTGGWSEAVTFPLKLWRDWTAKISSTRGSPVIEVPIAENLGQDIVSTLDSIPEGAPPIAHALSIFDCGPTGDEEEGLRNVVFSAPRGWRKKKFYKFEYGKSTKDRLQWDHYYCIKVLTLVSGDGPGQPYSIRFPTKRVYIPPKGGAKASEP